MTCSQTQQLSVDLAAPLIQRRRLLALDSLIRIQVDPTPLGVDVNQ
jgi:hypothetical protein